MVKKKENNQQIREDDSSFYLPQDLVEKILANLPTKSLVKLIVVSKLWSSIIRSKYFIDLYLKRSVTRPCFLFTFRRDKRRFFHSISQEAAPSSSRTSSFPLSLDTRPLLLGYNVCPPVRGLIFCRHLDKVVISNPSTGQFLVLPKLKTKRKQISRFFGYDPIEDEYKVLCMTVLQVSYNSGPVVSEEHQVFTLGGAQKKKAATWRTIACKLPHFPATNGLCFNGVVYYGAWSNSDRKGSLIVAFNVRLEDFTLVKLPIGVEIYKSRDSELVNYQRKVALANHSYKGNFELWVLDKQEWSKISVVVPSWNDLVGRSLFYCRGAISSGEFIFTPSFSDGSFFIIISYDSKEEIVRRVGIEGIGDGTHYVTSFLDYVECPIFL
ncbi:F-box associated domain type 3 [Arabidopsis thaliana x Arabidopsis arenosa]|uniref:F-box associated domain type 3 n=1 Tax=Arabidopsis thaliana x Arabidopsis arenosa TaxID=1240361 RepID=A0A8T1YV71_9BRAS|nr:F-box associated domain type 3 [Arabidopsis thaliana x Arabidopsis arenosa]